MVSSVACVSDRDLLELMLLVPELKPFDAAIRKLIKERGKIPAEVARRRRPPTHTHTGTHASRRPSAERLGSGPLAGVLRVPGADQRDGGRPQPDGVCGAGEPAHVLRGPLRLPGHRLLRLLPPLIIPELGGALRKMEP